MMGIAELATLGDVTRRDREQSTPRRGSGNRRDGALEVPYHVPFPPRSSRDTIPLPWSAMSARVAQCCEGHLDVGRVISCSSTVSSEVGVIHSCTRGQRALNELMFQVAIFTETSLRVRRLVWVSRSLTRDNRRKLGHKLSSRQEL